MVSDVRSRRRWPWVVAGAIVLVLVVAVVVRLTFIRDHAREVGAQEALDRFRASETTAVVTTDPPAATTVPVRSLPAPGVYRYVTDGEESIDALGGATHRYPAETTITVTPDGCGLLFRWDALEERRDEWRLCSSAVGLTQGDGLQYHEFFGQSDSEAFVCPNPPVMLPATVEPGPPVEIDCTLDGDPWITYWQVIGLETRTVAGTAVATVHVRQSVNDPADMGEQSTVDWYLDEHGLPIFVTSTKRSKSSTPIGPVVYKEQYTLSLESLAPER